MDGSKFLFLLWPETSAYNATFQLARALTACGAQVAYAVPDRWAETITRQGFRAVVMDLAFAWPPSAGGGLRRIINSRRVADARLAELRRSLSWIKTEGFDGVLLYTTLWQHALALRQLGIPFVSVNPSLASTWSPDVPPIFSSLLPDPHHPWRNRLRCCAAWLGLRYLGAFSHRYHGIIPDKPGGLRAPLRDALVTGRHLVNAATESLRMPEYFRLLSMAPGMGVQVGWGDYAHRLKEPELVFGSKVLDFAAQTRRPGRMYVGACVDTQRVEDTFDWSGVDASRPLVYCAIGSHGAYWNQKNRRRLVHAVIEAFNTRPQYQLLLQLAGKDDETFLGPLRENILAAPWFPQLEVLSRCSLMITHGGFGSLREILFYGVPMILFPCGVDQPGNAARVVQLGAGVVGNIQSVTPADVARQVDQVMGDPAYRAAAQRIQAVLRAENDCAAAISFLDAALARS